MDSFKHVIILITAADNEEAKLIAQVLLEQRKAACVNIVSSVSSIFRWQGVIKNETESLLIVKSSAALLNDVIETVKEVHSYETPEIIALPIIGGSADYLEWLDESVESDESPAA
ncbi:MAG: divalent-cation tolerance protein CutA [Dehalococcoidia bacterium]|nr:MAG: divalent-cation tolerance protein CutA [Dehalococcoidia bacterium]